MGKIGLLRGIGRRGGGESGGFYKGLIMSVVKRLIRIKFFIDVKLFFVFVVGIFIMVFYYRGLYDVVK